MLVSAQGTVDEPVAVLNVEGQAADEGLLFVGRGNEVKAILVFGVQHDKLRVGFEGRQLGVFR
ncbi:hypothetical protein D3C71_1984460 [compost metagenome]